MAGASGVPGRVTTPLMRLQDPRFTRILIVTLPEATPMSEAAVLQDGLRRAGIEPFGWVVNAALTGSGTRDPPPDDPCRPGASPTRLCARVVG
jgi:Mrp family chromosome partitioning ATPase